MSCVRRIPLQRRADRTTSCDTKDKRGELGAVKHSTSAPSMPPTDNIPTQSFPGSRERRISALLTICSSRVRGNSHARFLGGESPRGPTYPN